MYYINELLIRNIHTLHRMTQREFSTFAFGKNQFFPQRLCRFHLFTVNDIIKLSNSTHIPIRHFFSTEKEGRLYGSLADIRCKTEWKDITVNFDQLKKISLGNGYSFSRQELLTFLNIDVSCFWKWTNMSFAMGAQMLCDMCNEFGIDMSDIIIDENDIIPPATSNKFGSKTKAKLTRMQRRIEDQQKIADSNKDHAERMEAERDAALEELAKMKIEKTVIKTQYITETIEPEWQWQARQWGDDDIPTLTQLIAYCNRHRITTLPFLANPKRRTYSEHEVVSTSDNATVANANDTPQSLAETTTDYKSQPAHATSNVSLDYMAFTMLMRTLGETVTPDTLSIVKFCRILADNHLTPACCINDPDANYTTTLPDRLVRALGNAGITA